MPAYSAIRGEARLKLYDDLRASLQSDAAAKLLAAHAEELAREKANHEDTASVRDFFENELKSVREKHGQELAAYRKALESFRDSRRVLNTIEVADSHPVYVIQGNSQWLVSFAGILRKAADALESSGAGKALLDAHAAELITRGEKAIADYVDDHGITCDCCQHVMIDVTSVRRGEKTHCIAGDPEGEGSACAHGMTADSEALRQRVEAAESKLEAVKVEISGDANFGRMVELLFYGPLREKEAELRLAYGKIEASESALENAKGVHVIDHNDLLEELANLRASQAADLNRIEESYNRLIRELEEGKRKAEAERDEARQTKTIICMESGESPSADDLQVVAEYAKFRRFRRALENIYMLARRERRKSAAAQVGAWDHIIRFCREVGLKTSVLRTEATEAQAKRNGKP